MNPSKTRSVLTRGSLLIFAIFFSSSTRGAAQTNPCYNIVVAQDGSGNYTRVQDAFNAVPNNSSNRTVIYVKNGTYKEALNLPNTKQNVTLLGQSQAGVILTYDNNAQKVNPSTGVTFGTSGSSSTFIRAVGFFAQNITFQNSSTAAHNPALAIYIAGDKAVFVNCKFSGPDDTIYNDRCRQYFQDCYIEGNTDFIFGPATAVFSNTELHSHGGTALTAASTETYVTYGYVFLNCKVTADTGITTDLGRPWRPYAAVAFLNCNLGSFIKPPGWDNWGDPANEATARYNEYQNTSTNAVARVSWSHQLTAAQAAAYTTLNILKTTYANPPATDNWNPMTVINSLGSCGSTSTPTRTSTRTSTPLPPTATRTSTSTASRTNTPMPSTATSTSTRTATATSSRTNTPIPATSTSTLTATPSSTASRTLTSTRTPTMTNTVIVTASSTATFTPTRTETATVTRTATPTSTNTAMPSTATLTSTRTMTSSSTSTSVPATATSTMSSSMTATRTATASSTSTNSPMANSPTASSTLSRTQTATSTETPTSTNTLVLTATSSNTPQASTPTFTATGSMSATPTLTASQTSSPSMTPTASSSATRTATSSATSTASPSATSTVSSSSTPSATNTSVPPTMTPTLTASTSATRTSSPTLTASPSATPFSTSTLTATPSVTSTSTGTLPPTASLTQTPSFSRTSTATSSPSSSMTPTATSSPTLSATLIFTATQTSTRTSSPTASKTSTATPSPTVTATLSQTSSMTPSSTATLTMTPAPTMNPGAIPVLSDNPSDGSPIQVLPQSFTGVSPVTVQIFTEKFLLVQTKVYGAMSLGWVTLELTGSGGQPLANGMYYIMVTTKDGRATAKLLILR